MTFENRAWFLPATAPVEMPIGRGGRERPESRGSQAGDLELKSTWGRMSYVTEEQDPSGHQFFLCLCR